MDSKKTPVLLILFASIIGVAALSLRDHGTQASTRPRDNNPGADHSAAPVADTTKQSANRVAQSQEALETTLSNEQRSESWAAYQEGALRKALADDVLIADGIQPPTSLAVECRASQCKVQFSTTGDEPVDGLTFHATTAVTESLNTGRIFNRTEADGSVRTTLYLSNVSPPRSSGPLPNGRTAPGNRNAAP